MVFARALWQSTSMRELLLSWISMQAMNVIDSENRSATDWVQLSISSSKMKTCLKSLNGLLETVRLTASTFMVQTSRFTSVSLSLPPDRSPSCCLQSRAVSESRKQWELRAFFNSKSPEQHSGASWFPATERARAFAYRDKA